MTAPASVLALDAGTGSGRAALFGLDGRLLGVASRRWSFTTPPALDPVGKEFSTEQFFGWIAEATREAHERAGRPEVRAIAATGLRGGSVLLDATGETVAASPIQDVRALMTVGDVDDTVPDLYARTGHSPTWLFPLARLAWYRSEAPALFERVTTLLSIDEWLLFALSGERRATPSSAGDSMCFAVGARAWDREILDRLGLPAGVLPPLAMTGETVGRLTPSAARMLGLAAGIPVVACAGDTQAALLGSRALDPDTVGVVAGTTAPVMAVSTEPVADPKGCLWLGCHPLANRWVLEGNSGRAGSSLDWTLELLGLDAPDRFGELERLVSAVAPGSNRAFAFLGAEPVDLSNLNPARPAGFLFPAPELGFVVGRGEILRATLENIAFAVEANLRRIARVMPLEGAELALTGGLSVSPSLAQIVADVTGRTVHTGVHGQGAALGCAVAAATAVGAYGSLREAAQRMVERAHLHAPDADRHGIYLDAFEAWHERWRTFQSIT